MPLSQSEQALETLENEGLIWLRATEAIFDDTPYDPKVAAEKAAAASAEEAENGGPDPAKFTDREWGKLVEPLTEFGGYEYRLTDSSLEAYGKRMRAAALRDKANGGVTVAMQGALPLVNKVQVAGELRCQPARRRASSEVTIAS